jgi:serine/threonine protein kinase
MRNEQGIIENKEFGKFTLLEHMGKGGVASVYRAIDNQAGNIVAIKIFSPDEKRGADRIRKLRDREVRMLISIQHPNVVKYYESGDVVLDGERCFYYTMEFVENSLLARMQKPDAFSLADKVYILRQCANALQAIHHQGIVHRDIKPGNILLDQSPTGAIHVKVTDLGIAKHVSETDIVREETSKRVPGTPKYLSPEQIRLQPVDGRADVFSLGVVAYELLTGKQPFKAETSEEYVKANLRQAHRPAHHVQPEVPEWLSPLLDKMLAKEREERYDSDTLARDLELAYQHMVSNAPLVEPHNPDSVFYVPPAPEPGEAKKELPRKRVPVRNLAVAAFILVGAICTFAMWPQIPPPPPGPQPLPPPAELSNAAALKQANELAILGRRWKALALLRRVNLAELSDEQSKEWQRICELVQSSLAQEYYDGAMDLIRAGRLPEAEVALQRMEQFCTFAPQTADLRKAIETARERVKVNERWDASVNYLKRTVRDGKFEEAITEAEKLLGDVVGDAKKEAEVQALILSAVNKWGQALAMGQPDREHIERYREFANRFRGERWAEGKVEDYEDALTLKLGDYYNGIRDYVKAREIYEKLWNAGGAHAAEAKKKLDAILSSGDLPPVEIVPTSQTVEREGFASKAVWWPLVPDGGRQELVERVVQMVQVGGTPARRNVLTTMRPLRSVEGFHVGVKFRMRIEQPDKVQKAAAGIWVGDKIGNQVAFYFNGKDYEVYHRYLSGGKFLEGSAPVKPGFGDETRTAHELSMRYQFDLEKLVVSLDGKDVKDYTKVELGAFQCQVFLEVAGEGECKAAFQDVFIRKP